MVRGGSTGTVAGVAAAVLAVAGAVTGWWTLSIAAAAAALVAVVVVLRQQGALLEARACGDALTGRFAELERARAEAEQAAEQAERRAAATADRAPSGGIEAVTDRVTGMFNETFFRVSLDQRVLAARRHLRPVALVLLDVVRSGDDGWSPADPVLVATALRTTLREADTACRLADGRFALVLEDTPEDGAVWAVERLRRTLLPGRPELVVWAGVACYPAHAFDAMDVLERAAEALVAAREWRRDRIEVAPSPD